MRYGIIAALAAFAALFVPAANAEDAPKDVKGLFLMTDYPAVTVRPGETTTISLRLQNYDMPPERMDLAVSGAPAGWNAKLLGGGQPVDAAMAATNSSVALSLRLDVPKNAQAVATLLREWLLVYLRARIDIHMMLGFVEHLFTLPYSFFQQRSTGDLLARVGSNAMLRELLSNQLLSTVLDSGLVAFYLVVLLWQSPPFGLLTLAVGMI